MKNFNTKLTIFCFGILFFLGLVIGKNIFTRLTFPLFPIYTDSWMYWLMSGIFAIFYIIIMLILNAFKKFDWLDFCVASIIVGAILIMRISLLDGKSGDYVSFLAPWVRQLSTLSFKDFLLINIGDYNFSYLYILFLISKVHITDLYLIKLVSIVFDIILSFLVVKNISFFKDKINWKIPLFILTFGLPTVVLNSSYWAQCDAIYVTLALFGLFLILKNSFNLAMLFLGLSLAFKLQAIFILPIILVLWFKKDVKIKNFLFFILGFLLPLIPPLIAGRGIVNTFNVYYNQVNSYRSMTLNAPTLWSLICLPFFQFGLITLLLVLILLTLIFYFLILKKDKLNKSALINLVFLFSLVVPYFLPKMHERYFYMAEILSILYFVYNPKKWYYPLIIQICSLSTYSNFLFGVEFFNLKIGGLLMGFLVLSLLKDFFFENVLIKK